MFTSDMLSMLSTWTSMPTGIAEPAKRSNVRISFEQQLDHFLHESSVCTSARDYLCVNPTAELYDISYILQTTETKGGIKVMPITSCWSLSMTQLNHIIF